MMHDIVIDELERHLSGNASRSFYDHLEACAPCREEVAEMTELSQFVSALKGGGEAAPEPSLGFYERVAMRIEDGQRRQAWGLFTLGELFFRRLAFASLMVLAVLGSYLVTRETSYGGQDAAAIMAQHDPSAGDHGEAQDRDYMLVTLANYRQ